ncbi:OLC1v1039063C1 [Oldenlandia corymbosa var. corymbosa]|uniref:OLC1v1039063C1 n=1 Tax=Oldenlandia corymbosa var. corymbosa TaxID=529605 RepID=A0AAV1D1F5_OLDCO|nr:OLC1v1039063C1 [Oldenlandia corymbosa var. corymbosa]
MASSSTRIMSSYSCEMRPRLLKEFLSDDSSLPSSSSFDHHGSLFKKSSSLKNPRSLLLRNRSKSASSISISAIHKASEAVIKAIKFLPFARGSAIKTPSLLPRSLSRKKSKRDQIIQSEKHSEISNRASFSSSSEDQQQVETPKIKDILRWKSFRDVVEDLSNKWLESDFAPEDLNSLDNLDDDDYGRYYFMDHQKTKKKKNRVDQGRFSFEEDDEQSSPVSVLNDSVFLDDDHEEGEPVSFFNRTVETMERRKNMLMQRLKEFENLAKLEQITHEEEGRLTKEENATTKVEESNCEVEAKARELLSQVKATSSSSSSTHNDIVLLDFFRQELAASNNGEIEMLKTAQDWMSKEYCEGTFDCELLDCKEACLKDMEIGPMKWTRSNNFGEEQQELGRDVEIQVLNDLLDEVLGDLLL